MKKQSSNGKINNKAKNKNPELYENIYKDNFSFGDNWKSLLAKIDSKRVEQARQSLVQFTGLASMKEKTFLDIGCGSGLFSLAAAKMGANVVSVDIDDSSIACAEHLRTKFKIPNTKWKILKGSALDKKFLASLPNSDIVYSWGVLHHTGKMYEAIEKIAGLVKNGGLFYIAIYNDFKGVPFSSRAWVRIKRFYSKRGRIVRGIMARGYAGVIIAGLIAYRKNPIKYIKEYSKNALRGMDFYIDVKDWMGGYPYEYASADEITSFFKKRGFSLSNIKKTEREGCNEFLFKKR